MAALEIWPLCKTKQNKTQQLSASLRNNSQALLASACCGLEETRLPNMRLYCLGLAPEWLNFIKKKINHTVPVLLSPTFPSPPGFLAFFASSILILLQKRKPPHLLSLTNAPYTCWCWTQLLRQLQGTGSWGLHRNVPGLVAAVLTPECFACHVVSNSFLAGFSNTEKYIILFSEQVI